MQNMHFNCTKTDRTQTKRTKYIKAMQNFYEIISPQSVSKMKSKMSKLAKFQFGYYA